MKLRNDEIEEIELKLRRWKMKSIESKCEYQEQACNRKTANNDHNTIVIYKLQN